MSKSALLERHGLQELSREEKRDLAEALWDDVDEPRAELIPIPPAHLEELKRRAAEMDANPDDFIP